MPIMLLASYIYVAALVAVGRRVSEDRPKPVRALAGQLVWLIFIPFLLAPFFWLILTEVSVDKGMELWPVVKMLTAVLISYLTMVAPGFYYIFKCRIRELNSYGYFRSNT